MDSRRARRELQNELPAEVFDASTTDIREVVRTSPVRYWLATSLCCAMTNVGMANKRKETAILLRTVRNVVPFMSRGATLQHQQLNVYGVED